MDPPSPRLPRPFLRASLAFFAVLLLAMSAAGVFLAANPHVGGYAFTSTRPYAKGSTPQYTSKGRFRFFRATDGFLFDSTRTAPPPDAVVLGWAAYELSQSMVGHPRYTRIRWSLDITEIEPTPDGPPASDVRAWRAIVAQSMSRPYPDLNRPHGMWQYGPAPASLLAGEAEGATFRIGAFALNALERLYRAPAWSGACLALAILAAFLVFRPASRTRRRFARGECLRCGYDLRGQSPGSPCPECGTPAAARTPALAHGPEQGT